MARNLSGQTRQPEPASSFGERLRFVIWLAALRLGVESGKDLADVLGKGSGQLSSWANENPRPSYDNIKLIAEKVGVSAAWLDDPSAKESEGREPELFAEWLAKRRARERDREKHRRRA